MPKSRLLHPHRNRDARLPRPRLGPRFVLASGSPRRWELLEKAGYEFEVIVPVGPEVFGAWFTIRELTISNAARKLLAIARRFPNAVVLSADTLVALDGNVIGKPANHEEARGILRRLSGRTTCDVCQRTFFGREPGETCNVDGHEPQGTLTRRADDEPAAVRKRLNVYRDQTAPVIDWYRQAIGPAMVTINATGTPEEVEQRAIDALAQVKRAMQNGGSA